MIKVGYRLVLFLVLLSCIPAHAQEKPCKQAPLLISMLNKFHYCPPDPGEKTSVEVFNSFIQKLDPSCSIFTTPDIAQLDRYKNQLLTTSSDETACKFLNAASGVYQKCLYRSDSLTNLILQKPFDYNLQDSIRFSYDYMGIFAANAGELEKHLAKKLKFDALNILFNPMGDDVPTTMSAAQIVLKDAEARKKLGIRKKRALQRILDYPSGLDGYVAEQFYNAIANRYDPHTLYFSPSGKEKFQAAISKESKAFGLSFEEGKNGDVEIGYLTPGGPAWKSGQLHKGDVVIQAKWPKGEPVDLTCSGSMEVDDLINNSTYDKLLLTIKPANGTQNAIPLVKELINVEENTISGYVLDGDKKIGYICLPGFYSDWNTENALGCANDVAKEILKLQKEKIEGLILDLRYNGGGSLAEAIGLMGIFIDEGPLFMIREKDQKPVIMKDLNRGTVYNGPLILMVNGFSASASELVVAGLRDYNRALIVGSNTYGKAIAQVTLPLDTTIKFDSKLQSKRSSGFVNVTMRKLYRINGVSHQKTGIAPDIELPDLFKSIDYGEASNPYAIGSDKVDKKVFYNPLPELPVHELAEASRKRTEASEVFVKIKQMSDSIHDARKHPEVLNLNIESFRKYRTTIELLESQVTRSFAVPAPKYNVMSAHYDDAVLHADNYRNEMNDMLLKKIKDDIYIEEVLLIMDDLINLKKNKP